MKKILILSVALFFISLPLSASAASRNFWGSGTYTQNKTTGAAPVLSSCGTTPAISGTALAGKVTIGTGATTSCTVTFAKAYSAAPACVIAGDNTGIGYAATTAAGALTITSSADMASDVISYICFGL